MRSASALGLVAVVAAALTSCAGASGYGASRPSAGPPSPAATASPSPSEAPSPVPMLPSPAPAVAPVAPPRPAPIAPAASQSFPLLAVGDTMARGSVTVTMEGGRAVVAVVASGLPPGSVHSVHLHFGNCPGAGSHILVLGTLRADGGGFGSVTGTVNPAFTGAGHFVIVYVGPAAGRLGACANLG